LIETAVKPGGRHFIFSSTAAVLRQSHTSSWCARTVPTVPSPYGFSKLVTETMLRDAAAHGLRRVILR
jgi:UDP-glucose 4-epimerase